MLRRRTALVSLLIVCAWDASARGRQTESADTAVQRVLDDYIGLYRGDALERWKTLFLPGFTASYTNDNGTVTTRNLEEFYERQRRAFAAGPVSETLHNVRMQRVGRLAHVFADFQFTGRGSTRPGQLMLLMIEEKGQLKIAALTFTYHVAPVGKSRVFMVKPWLGRDPTRQTATGRSRSIVVGAEGATRFLLPDMDGQPPEPPDTSDEPLEVLWRLQTVSGVVWECVWYRTVTGFELRVRREGNERDVIALRRFTAITEDIARYAAGWKRAAMAKGWKEI
jgi:hypothetical protein